MDKVALDRWLTTPPDDFCYDNYCDNVFECLPSAFFDAAEDWLFSKTADKLLDKLFDKGIDYDRAALIIERYYNIYVKQHG